MKPAPFSYHAPASVQELLDLTAADDGSGRVLAGGQSLMPLLNMRRLRVARLFDINGLTELDYVEESDGTLALGALLRQGRALADPVVRSAAPLVSDALPSVASPTVRNRGTVCGSIAFAQPAAQLTAVALAMGGDVLVRSAVADRRIPLDSFFKGAFATALGPGEVVTELRLTTWPEAGHAFLEVSRMRVPVVNAAVLVELAGGVVSRCAVALAGVADTPVRADAVESALVGAAPTDDAVAEAAALAAETADTADNVHGSATYRRQLARVLVRRAVGLAARRAGEAGR